MWSIGGSPCRSWLTHQLDQASRRLLHQQVVVTTGRAARHGGLPAAPISRTQARKQARRATMAERTAKYGRWTKTALIRRIDALEYQLAQSRSETPAVSSTDTAAATPAATEADSFLLVSKNVEQEGEGEGEENEQADSKARAEPQRKKKKKEKRIDPSKYSTRLVALKLAYLGKNYGGFEFATTAHIPTIEEELWIAMVKACLIFPENPDEVNWESIEYSKCGRTDRGVSAFGQVIGVRVRSNKPLPKQPKDVPTNTSHEITSETTAQEVDEAGDAEPVDTAPEREFDDYTDELNYPQLLNRLLPPDIRILAWCPTTPADFSARHHCRERQYRYFFTQPAYSPAPDIIEDPKTRATDTKPKAGWLDIDAMRTAAKKFEGLHDFRNFCKIDGNKPQQTFKRRIFESDIVEVSDAATGLSYLQQSEFQPSSFASEPTEPSRTASPPPPPEVYPKVFYFHVRGSAFLWHQIRCMVAILFMVGQGLEDASVVDKLLDIAAEPRRPGYRLANETPLVLWDCIFPRDLDDPLRRDDGLDWVYVGETNALGAHGPSSLTAQVWERWRGIKMDEILTSQLLGIVASQADLNARWHQHPRATRYVDARSQKMFEGGDKERSVGKYEPLLAQRRLPSPQEAFDKEARRKGYESAAHMQEVIVQRARAAVDVGDELIHTADEEFGDE
ncbi:pseudouridine synthase [Nemania sp. FL0916]|nr:pseudouridine synthase [Nemania sp. FL0916]